MADLIPMYHLARGLYLSVGIQDHILNHQLLHRRDKGMHKMVIGLLIICWKHYPICLDLLIADAITPRITTS